MAIMRLALALVVVSVFAAAPIAAGAHPLGNFTVNHMTRLSVHGRDVELRYILDMAEIPTVALEHSLAADGSPSQSQLNGWAAAHAAGIAAQLELDADGMRLVPSFRGASVVMRPGAAGLHTTYLRATYMAILTAGVHSIVFHDRTEGGRLGWKDAVLSPATEPTRELTSYPSALVGSPRARTVLALAIDSRGGARVAADPADEDASVAAPPSVARMNALSDILTTRGTGPGFLLGALLLALGLGALHALEPGHGKTLLAVSLVGARATASQAVVLASSLTVAHTAGVIVLGAIVLFATRWIVPETVYPWITLGSGILVATLGARALAAQVRRRDPVAHVRVDAHALDHSHAHSHAHDHSHAHPHVHEHGVGAAEHRHGALDDEQHARSHAVPGTAPLSFRTAVLAAASGNLAPCPAALVVLLAAISLHRIALGMLLIVAFSVGLAATLTLLGMAVVRGAAWLSSRPQFDMLARYAPFVSAGAIALVGAFMIGQGAVAQGIPAPLPIVAGLVLLAIVGYALRTPHARLHPRSSGA